MDSSYDFALGVIIIEHWKCTQGTFRANSTNSVYSVCVIVSNFCLEKKVFLEIRHLVKPLLFLLIYAKRFCWVVVAVGKLLRQTKPINWYWLADISCSAHCCFKGCSIEHCRRHFWRTFFYDVNSDVVWLWCECFSTCSVSVLLLLSLFSVPQWRNKWPIKTVAISEFHLIYFILHNLNLNLGSIFVVLSPMKYFFLFEA